jgi:hypothetical protein
MVDFSVLLKLDGHLSFQSNLLIIAVALGQLSDSVVHKLHFDRSEDHVLNFIKQVRNTGVFAGVSSEWFKRLIHKVGLGLHEEGVEPPKNYKILAFYAVANFLKLALGGEFHRTGIEVSFRLDCLMVFFTQAVQQFVHLDYEFSITVWREL